MLASRWTNVNGQEKTTALETIKEIHSARHLYILHQHILQLCGILTNYFNSLLCNPYVAATVRPSAMDCQDKDQNQNSEYRDKTSASTEPSNVTEQPLQSLKLASHAVLEEAQQRGRLKCSKCGGSRKFFCYTCCSLVGVTQEEIPIIKVGMKSVNPLSNSALLVVW